jgi:hypothetical protein
VDRIILDNIPFNVEEQAFIELLRIPTGARKAEQFSELLSQAHGIAAPKAAYIVSAAYKITDDTVGIGGVHLQSRLLCDNLDKTGKVFPFIATCGAELEEWSLGIQNVMHAFWADGIMLMALGCAVSYLEADLKAKTGKGVLSCMNPGSLPEWPLSDQTKIFALLGEAAAAVGVRLKENMSMCPLKSISGIYFMSEKGFCNCKLCSKERCIMRRAAYGAGQEALYTKGRSLYANGSKS